MKTKLLTLLLLILPLSALTIKVNLESDIDIKKSGLSAISKIVFKPQYASTYKDYYLLGRYSNEFSKDGRNKITVRWTHLKKDGKTKAISSSFISILATTKDIPKNSPFKAKGDVMALQDEIKGIITKAITYNSKGQEVTTDNKDKGGSDISLSSSNSKEDDKSPSTEKIDDMLKDKEPFVAKKVELAKCPYKQIGDKIQFYRVGEGNKCVKDGLAVPIKESIDNCKSDLDIAKAQVEVFTDKKAGSKVIEYCSSRGSVALQFKDGNCKERIDLINRFVIKQKQGFFTYKKMSKDIGGCEDGKDGKDKTILIPKEEINKRCSPYISMKDEEVKMGFRLIANYKGQTLELAPCKFKDEVIKLTKNYSNCSVSHNMIGKKSYQQYQYEYIYENKTNAVGGCVDDKDLSYPHFFTDEGCKTDRLDSGEIIHREKIAYKNSNGITKDITSCEPTSNTISSIKKEKCSYSLKDGYALLQTREYYISPINSKVKYISKCEDDLSFRFNYQEEICGYVTDDTNLRMQKKRKKYFVDNSIFNGGKQYVDGICEAKNDFIPYANLGIRYELVKSLGTQSITKNSQGNFYYNSNLLDVTGSIPKEQSGGSENSFSIKNYDNGGSHQCVRWSDKQSDWVSSRVVSFNRFVTPKSCSGKIINKRFVRLISGTSRTCNGWFYSDQFYTATCDMSYSYLTSPIYKYKKYTAYRRADNSPYKIYQSGYYYTTYKK